MLQRPVLHCGSTPDFPSCHSTSGLRHPPRWRCCARRPGEKAARACASRSLCSGQWLGCRAIGRDWGRVALWLRQCLYAQLNEADVVLCVVIRGWHCISLVAGFGPLRSSSLQLPSCLWSAWTNYPVLGCPGPLSMAIGIVRSGWELHLLYIVRCKDEFAALTPALAMGTAVATLRRQGPPGIAHTSIEQSGEGDQSKQEGTVVVQFSATASGLCGQLWPFCLRAVCGRSKFAATAPAMHP
jgi:hypothetical protein